MSRILVWDLPVRLVHWTLAGSFVIAYATGDSEAWRNVHVAAGLVFTATILFRILWGLAGTRYARFTSFVRGPGAVFAYLRSLLTLKPQHWTGHNPAGGWAILALLGFAMVTALSGLVSALAASTFLALGTARRAAVLPHLVSFATGALLGAAFLGAAARPGPVGARGHAPGRPGAAARYPHVLPAREIRAVASLSRRPLRDAFAEPRGAQCGVGEADPRR